MVDFRIDVVVNPRGAVTGTRVVERQLVRVENQADRTRASLQRMVGLFAGGALLGQGVRTLANFEQSLANAGSIAGATADQFEQLRDRAQELGATTRFTATDAAEGLTFLARAGFDVADSLETVDDALRLAQVGQLSLASAADISTNALSAFQLGADDASRFVDVLAFTASRSNTNVQQLGDALKFVGPVAAAAGIDLETAASAIGTLSDAGLQGTLAGTGLRRALSSLLNPTNEARQALAQLGVNVADLEINSETLLPIFEDLGRRGLSAAQALTIFGDRGGPAALVLAGAAEEAQKFNEAIRDSGGFAEETARRLDDNLQGSLLRVRSAFEAVILELGDAGGTGALRSFADSIAEGLRFAAANAEQLLNGLTTLAAFITQVLVGRALRSLLLGIRSLTIAIAANPIGALITALTAATSLLIGFRNEIKLTEDGLANLGDLFAVTFEALGDIATPILEGIIALFNETFGESFEFSIRGFVEAAAFGFDRFVGIVRGSIFAVNDTFKSVFTEVIPEYVLEGVNLILAGLEALLDGTRAVVNTIITILDQAFGAIGQAAVGLGRAIDQALSGSAEGALNALEDAEVALNRAIGVAGPSNLARQYRAELRKLQQDRTIDEIENRFAGSAAKLGENIRRSFLEGFEQDTILGFVGSLFDQAEDRARERAARQAEEAKRRAEERARAEADAARAAAARSGRGDAPIVGDDGGSNARQLASLRQQIDLQQQLNEQRAVFQTLIAETPELFDEASLAFDQLRISALESSNALEDGFVRAFIKIKQEAEDLAAVGEAVVNTFADRATDAIVAFAETGQFSFREFTAAILKDLLRIITRLLIVQALNAAFGGVAASGGSLGTSGAALAGSRQEGGTVQPGRSFLVGENGPEIFKPEQTGSIIPNPKDQPQQAQPVTVQVVNVQSEDEIPQAISGGGADEAIINALARNKDRVRQVVQ